METELQASVLVALFVFMCLFNFITKYIVKKVFNVHKKEIDFATYARFAT